MRYLLDTHTLLWWIADDARLTGATRAALATATPENPLHLASISRWEIAMLVSLGRVTLSVSVREWLERATVTPLLKVHGISAAIASGVAGLPESFHRDPADRLIVATARQLGATILTVDRQIVDSTLARTLS